MESLFMPVAAILCLQFITAHGQAPFCTVEDICTQDEIDSVRDTILSQYQLGKPLIDQDDDNYGHPLDLSLVTQCRCEFNENIFDQGSGSGQDQWAGSGGQRRQRRRVQRLPEPVTMRGKPRIHFALSPDQPDETSQGSQATSTKALNRHRRGHQAKGKASNRNLVTRPYYPWYGGGNYLSTSLCGAQPVFDAFANNPRGTVQPGGGNGYIYYRENPSCNVRSPCFGWNSSYRMQIIEEDDEHDLFHMRASVTTEDPNFSFVISGNLDSSGSTENFTFTSGDGQYMGFAYQTCGSGSTSRLNEDLNLERPEVTVNQLVIAKTGANTNQVVTLPGVLDRDDDDIGFRGYFQAIQNISKGPLSYFLWYGTKYTNLDRCWSESQFRAVFDAAIGTSCSAFDCSNTRVCSSGCAESPGDYGCTRQSECNIEDTCGTAEMQQIRDAIIAQYAEDNGVDGGPLIHQYSTFDEDDYSGASGGSGSGDDERISGCLCETNSSLYNQGSGSGTDASRERRSDAFGQDIVSEPAMVGRRSIHFQLPSGAFGGKGQRKANPRSRSRRDTGHYIPDGGFDQYDDGNYLSTSLCGGQKVFDGDYDFTPGIRDGTIYYRTDPLCNVQTPCFGPNSSYRMQIIDSEGTEHGLFHMRASVTIDDPNFFFIVSGNLGMDGYGNTENFTMVSGDGQYKGFAWQTCNGNSTSRTQDDDDGDDDPTVNHLIIVKNGAVIQRVAMPGELDYNDEDDFGLDGYFQMVQNISKGPLSYYMWYGTHGSRSHSCWDRDMFVNVFNSAIETSCSNFDCSNTKVCSTGCGDDPEEDECTIIGTQTTQAPPIVVQSSAEDDSLSGGAVAGIIIAVVIVVVGVAVGIKVAVFGESNAPETPGTVESTSF